MLARSCYTTYLHALSLNSATGAHAVFKHVGLHGPAFVEADILCTWDPATPSLRHKDNMSLRSC